MEGGETLVVDILPVLEELKEKHPKQFETVLCTCQLSKKYHFQVINNL